jgi:hypothetical protein
VRAIAPVTKRFWPDSSDKVKGFAANASPGSMKIESGLFVFACENADAARIAAVSEMKKSRA